MALESRDRLGQNTTTPEHDHARTLIFLSARLLHSRLNEPPIDWYSCPMSQEHPNLHHPPVCDGIHRQFVVEDGDLEDSHPGKEANLEEKQ